MRIDSYLFSDIGGREENQDAVGRLEGDNAGLYVVADGLGGHQQGRLSSDCIVSTLTGGADLSQPCEPETLAALIQQANEEILRIQQEKNVITKSTVVALAINGQTAAWANTGDSRLYYLHGSELRQITVDHSVAYKKYQAGEITKEEIGQDEDQASLLRTLGGESRWEPDSGKLETLRSGDGFLLCSDGVWECLLDEEILVDYLKADSARDWASFLLLRIAERLPRDHDNFSLITILI